MTSLTQSRFFTSTCTVTRPPAVGESTTTAILAASTPCTAVYPASLSRWDLDVQSDFKGYEFQLETNTPVKKGDIVTVGSTTYTVIQTGSWEKLFSSTYKVLDVLLEAKERA